MANATNAYSTFHTPVVIADYEHSARRVKSSRERRAQRTAAADASRAKRNVIVAVIVMVLVVLAVVAVDAAAENARFDRAYNLPRAEVVVTVGDTIESIAEENPVDGLSTHELAYVISDINEDNHSIPLMPGDRLNVPVNVSAT